MNNFSNKFQNTLAKSFPIILMLLGLALSVTAGWSQRQKITSAPRGVGAQFGNAVAINGSTMVVGARFDSTTASQAGAAFVYVLSGGTWTQQQKLAAGDGTADDEFGNAVGIVGETIAVGAHFADLPNNPEAGSVYIYRRTGTIWAQTQKLIPTAAVILSGHFGESVAMSGSKIAIGAAGDDTPFTAAGAVYVFADNGGGYVQQQKLTTASGANGDSFGNSVAVEGNTLIGGALQYTPIVGQPAFGAAYIYEFNGSTWVSQGRIVASDGASVDRFGYSVTVSNNVAVGAREDDTTAGGPNAGSTYIFTRSGTTWTQVQKLAPTDTFNGDRFGVSVALSFGNLVVGAAERALTSPNGQGAIYYFTDIAKTRFDFDGDGKCDVSVFRPSNGTWYLSQSTNGFTATAFGISTDKPVPADYDGDGKTDIAVWRPGNGSWYVLRSEDSSFFGVPFGASGDVPVAGDYDGDGKADFSVFRPNGGNWFVQRSTAGIPVQSFGFSDDVPIPSAFVP